MLLLAESATIQARGPFAEQMPEAKLPILTIAEIVITGPPSTNGSAMCLSSSTESITLQLGILCLSEYQLQYEQLPDKICFMTYGQALPIILLCITS